MSLSEEADALAAKVGSSHHGTPSSAVLSNAGAKVNDLENNSGSGEPETEKHLPSSESPKLPESEADGREPEAKDLEVKNAATAEKGDEAEDKDASTSNEDGVKSPEDKKLDIDSKDGEEKPTEANDEGKKDDDSKDEDKEDETKDIKEKDPKSGDDGSMEQANTTDSDKSDDKGQKKDDNDKNVDIPPPPSPKSLGVDDYLTSPPDKASTFQEKDRPWEADGYATTNGLDSFAQTHGASQLGEAEWLQVLENCNAMYGWCIDGPMKRIVRAPKPAFQLKSVQPPEKPLNGPTTVSSVDHGNNSDASGRSAGGSSTASSSPGTLTPTSSTSASPTKPPTANSTSPASTDSPVSSAKEKTGASRVTTQKEAPTKPVATSYPSTSGTAKPSRQGIKPKRVLPDFSINDNSRIDIVISSHEFQTSMATNDFSASSTSASLGGSYGPVAASVSYSTDSMHSSSTSNTSDTYHKTMIAKYSFPRVDLNFDSCLEPTEGLKQAIAKVEATKNIKDLRQLRRDYGYLFCKSITIGGRLMTQALMDQSLTTSEQEQKQSLKTSVGLSVSSPEASGSVSHTQESGSDNSKSQAQDNKSESHTFEAMGGDSLLATNPTSWIPTVGSYKNWRIINRDGLVLMADMISGLSGFEHTRSWFEQAVPSLSKYIEFSDKLVKKIRFRLMSPNHDLCLSYKRGSDDPDFATPPNYYFGHIPLSTVMPLAMELEHPDITWGRIQMPNGKPQFLFHPGSYRAPAIYGYASNKVGDNLYGTEYDSEYKSTVWSITSPYDEALCNESRVIIQTVSAGDNSPARITGDSGNNAPSISPSAPVTSSLVVFRNQQGVFVPAMSDSKDVHVWRVLKTGAAPGNKVNIAEGDQIQLAWCFQDQYCGYRDFTEDAFGRRRNTAPPESQSSTLYMRLPWPRFEPVESLPDQDKPLPNALIMSEASTPQDNPSNFLHETITVIKDQKHSAKDILVEDCIFRVDVVKNHGRGDVDDYLLRGVSQKAIFPDKRDREALEKQLEEEEKERKEREEAERRAEQTEERERKSTGEVLLNAVFPITSLF
ncbi:Ff.00g099730.m01.CDS01 [Fusarium sp. VM40]|nr:Ff.00g099730.m01.CDS01 [Fusarium sp. VM40]